MDITTTMRRYIDLFDDDGRHVALQHGDNIEHGREVCIVDKASLIEARDSEQMIARAHDAGGRLVLVGDVRQLCSVGAGRPFAQL